MKRQVPPVAVDAEPAAVEEAEEEEPVTDAPAAKRRKPSQLSSKSLAAASEEHQRRGLCYLSRLPPFMKPAKLRHLLSQHGEVLRIYLAAEDAAARTRRKRAGGNSGKKFHEGWVEFADKKVARRVAESLNGSQMGALRRRRLTRAPSRPPQAAASVTPSTTTCGRSSTCPSSSGST
jgi:hypothetical protein